MMNIPPRENLLYKRATVTRECVCPQCGVIHKKLVELAHLDSLYSWTRAGFPIICCKECSDRLHLSDSELERHRIKVEVKSLVAFAKWHANQIMNSEVT